MADWRRYTPEGTQDVLPKQCENKMKTEAAITDVFESYGYQVAETPVMQFYDAFDTPSGYIPQETMFKFFDARGRILVLRPDITTCLTRMVACKLDDGFYPKRLYYCGKVFRHLEENTPGEREFCQAGIELFGAKGPVAEAEVIACAIESLLATGLTRFQIEIGQVDFFKAIMAQTSLTEEDVETLRSLIDKKDSLAISEFLKDKQVEEKTARLLKQLPTAFGNAQILDNFDTTTLTKEARDALKDIKDVYDILCAYGFENYISLDLSMLQGINHYTGIIFKGITHGIGYPICAGGRYDGLASEFGADLPAIGMAIDTDKLLAVLVRQNLTEPVFGSDFLVHCNDHGLCHTILTALRENGYIAERALIDAPFEELLTYAEKAEIQGILTVTDKDNATIYNLEEKKEIPVDLQELLNHEDNCECGHCH